MSQEITIPNELIVNQIFMLIGQKVILDKDLASLFGVETKSLKEQVRKNINRFPKSILFELTPDENTVLRSQIATLKRGEHSKYPPFAFTEHGILMLSSVLNSDRAVKMSIHIIEIFVQLRKLTNNYDDVLSKIQQTKTKYQDQFGEIYEILPRLIEKPKEEPRKKMVLRSKIQ